MVVTPKATFMHLPKTAGITVLEILRRAGLIAWHYQHWPLSRAPKDRPIFAFVRDPLDLYVSWFHYFLPQRGHPLLLALGEDGKNFETAISRLLNPDAALIRRYLEYALVTQFGEAFPEMVMQWQPEEPYYSFLRRMYCYGAVRYGRVERLRDDLKEMLESVGQLDAHVEEIIDTTPSQNVLPRSGDSRSYYSDGLRRCVEEAETEFWCAS